jgi:hypothetical protein
MVSAGQLGHHAAKGLVHLDLAVQSVSQQSWRTRATGVDQGHTRFIARGFNA